jgi:hypothetical protein
VVLALVHCLMEIQQQEVAEKGVQVQEETAREWSAEIDSLTVSFPVA